jgi:hypothetical protein
MTTQDEARNILTVTYNSPDPVDETLQAQRA